MNKGGKMLVYILSILAVGSACLAVTGFIISQQEKQKRIATEKELKATLLAKEQLNAQLDETYKAKAKIETELAKTRQKVEEMTSELTTKTKTIEDLHAAIESKDIEISDLRNSSDNLMAERNELVKNLTKAENELNELIKAKETLAKALEEKEALFKELSEGQKTQQPVELEKVVIKKEETNARAPEGAGVQIQDDGIKIKGEKPIAEEKPTSKLSGQILKINKEFDFIIIDAGNKDGVSVGSILEIYRDSKVLGRAQIEKVYDSLSAAAILPEYTKNEIKEGDSVRAL